MERNQDLLDYEQDLVQALWDQSYRRQTESPEAIQVFVSNLSVGTLECDSRVQAEKVFQTAQSTGLIELRSTTGLLVGTVVYDPQNPQTAHYQAGNYLVELDVQPEEGKTVIRVKARNLLVIMPQSSSAESPVDEHPKLRERSATWSMVALAAQLLLVGGVVFLVADRLFHVTTPQGGQRQLMTSQEQQLQQVLQQLTALQSRLDQTSVVSVANHEGGARFSNEESVAQEVQQKSAADDSLLAKKAESFKEGLLEDKPVWVRFKKGIDDQRRESFFKEVSAQDSAQVGGWYSFHMGVPESQSIDELLNPLSERGDIEIITTSVVTRKVQVRFKKDIKDEDVNGFFEEIRAKRGEPKDNWYHVNMNLPKPVDPKEFIGQLRSGKIIEQVKVNMDELPSM